MKDTMGGFSPPLDKTTERISQHTIELFFLLICAFRGNGVLDYSGNDHRKAYRLSTQHLSPTFRHQHKLLTPDVPLRHYYCDDQHPLSSSVP